MTSLPFFSGSRDPDPEAVLDCLADNGYPRNADLIADVVGDGLPDRDEDGPVWPFMIELTPTARLYEEDRG